MLPLYVDDRASWSSGWPISRRWRSSTTCACCTDTPSVRCSCRSTSCSEATQQAYDKAAPVAPRRSSRRPTRRPRARADLELDDAELLDDPNQAPIIRLRELAAVAGGQGARERHPHRAGREGPRRALPRSTACSRRSLKPPAEVPELDRQPRQDHGRAEHRREAPAAGRPHPHASSAGREIDMRVSTVPGPPRRAHRHASAREGRRSSRSSEIGMAEQTARRVPRAHPARRTASCSSPARPAPARRRRSTARSPRSTARTSTSSPSRTRSSTSSTASARSQVNPKIDLTFASAPARLPPPGPGRHHGRRDPRQRDRGDRDPGVAHRPPRVLDRSTRTTPRPRSPGSSTWASSRSSSPTSLIGVLAQRLVRTPVPGLQASRTRPPTSS